jgi:NADH dehydrogenase
LLPDLPEAMGQYSARALGRGGVRVVLGEFVAGLDDAGLHLKSGGTIAAATVVWSAGVRPSPLVTSLGLTLERGAIRTASDFSVPGHPGLWAIGDCASIPSPSGKPYPGTAQHAIREGPVLARNIVAVLRGRPTAPFRYASLGTMASLGARRGVADLGGRFILTGFPAWFLWRTYYLLRLPGLDRRIRVAFDWTLGLLFPRDIAELRVFARTIPRPAEAANAVDPESTSDRRSP